jgi:hypothetical protein
MPAKKVAGYTSPVSGVKIPKSSSVIGTGNVFYNIVDESKITGSVYEVTFNDTRDSGKFSPTTTYYNVRDTAYYTGTFVPSKIDTITALLPRQNIVPGTVTITSADGSAVSSTKYRLNYERGSIRAEKRFDLQSDTTKLKRYTIRYQYYPIAKSPYINMSPYVLETMDTDIFDGVQLAFTNEWDTKLDDTLSRFSNLNKSYGFTLSPVDVDINGDNVPEKATRYAADYNIIFGTVDSTSDIYGFPKTPTNFTVRNITTNKKVDVIWVDFPDTAAAAINRISALDQVLFFDRDSKDSLRYTWTITFTSAANGKDTVFLFGAGDTLKLRTKKPFRSGDKFLLATTKPKVVTSSIAQNLSNIRVVPNPYIVQSTRETPPTAGTFGRGERKIEFINVPQGATVSIYTSRGEHIRTLFQDGSIQNGTIKWDVKTKENLDIAYGVYFYVVESSAGTKTGKIAVIK